MKLCATVPRIVERLGGRTGVALAGPAAALAVAAAVAFCLARTALAAGLGSGALLLYLGFLLHRLGRPRNWRLLLPLPLLCALGLAHLAGAHLAVGGYRAGGLLAAACLALCLFFAGERARPLRRPRRQWLPAGALLLFGAAVFLWLGLARLDAWLALLLFLIFAGLVYRFDQRRGTAAPAPAPLPLPARLEYLLLALFFALGLYLRLAFLHVYPAGLYIDEAHSGQMAADIVRQSFTGEPRQWPPVFIAWGGGRCGFSYWFTALWFWALGRSEAALRLDAVVFAALTIPAFYYLMRQLVDGWTALLCTALLAANRWHLTFSPLAWGTPPMLFFACLGFGGLLSGIRRKRPLTILLGGMAVAASVNTYASARFLAVVFAAVLAGYLLWAARGVFGPWRRAGRDVGVGLAVLAGALLLFWTLSMLIRGVLFPPARMGAWTLLFSGLCALAVAWWLAARMKAWLPWRHALAALLGFYAAMMPLAHYALTHWQVFNQRAGQVYAWGPQYPGGIRPETLAAELRKSERPTLTKLRLFSAPVQRHAKAVLLSFHQKGDFIGRHNLPNAPVLGRVEGTLLLFGLCVLAARLGGTLSLVLLAWFLVPVGATIFFEPAPHMLRSLPALPAALGIMGAGMAVLWSLSRRYWGVWGAAPVGAALGFIVALGAWQSARLFTTEQIRHEAVIGGFSPAETASAEYIWQAMQPGRRGEPAHIAVSTPYPYNTASLKFLAYDRYPEVEPWNSGRLPFFGDGQRPILFFLEEAYDNVIPLIRHYFPEGRLVEVADRAGRTVGKAYHVAAEAYARRMGLELAFLSEAGDVVGATRVIRPGESLPPAAAGAVQARLTGMVNVEQPGGYRLRLPAGPEGADLRLNMQEVGSDRTLELLPGAQCLELLLPAAPAAPVVVEWQRVDHPQWEPIAASALYAVEPLGGGLLARVFAGVNWEGTPLLERRELLIQAPAIPLGVFSVEWTGFVHVPVSGVVGFRICSDDGSFLWINDELWVDNGGRHGRECRESARPLTAGRHALRLRYFQDGGAQTMELYWRLPGQPWEMTPAEAFSPPDP